MSSTSDLEERLSYLQLEARDLELLARLRPVLEEHADRFVTAFYNHLLSYPSLLELLRDPEIQDRLHLQQKEYLLSLAGPVIDKSYVEQRQKIGAAHERAGIGPRWYLGAYALYLSLLTPLIFEQLRHDPGQAQQTFIALQKLLMLDAQLTIETYLDRRERDLEALNVELARSGQALAEDLEERRVELRETTARAHAAEELASVAILVAGLAHEIGTPMGVIQGHARMLESEVQSDEATWRLRTIQEQIGRISNIIQALLNMARPGRTARMPVQLESVIETTLAFVTEKIRRRSVKVVREIQSVPSVLGDPERLQQVFLNLLLNAADSMPDGGVLEIRLTRPERSWLQASVTDNGSGIPQGDLDRIFEPFFTSKPAGKGSGLGLAVSRSIIREHGGTIEVTSREGQGTRFCIRLPIPDPEGASDSAAL
jgi:signal transduction histidine kinase